MKTLRCVTLIVSLAVIGVGLVYLRWEQTRIAAGLLRAETRWVELRRESWTVQAETARFRSPARIRGRIEVLHDRSRLLVDRYTSPADSLAAPFNNRPRYE